jgi:hypothetical protein
MLVDGIIGLIVGVICVAIFELTKKFLPQKWQLSK